MRAYLIAAMLATAGSAGQALAAPCYVVYDRNDAVVYRDYDPPFDLSDPNAPERAMMRQQKQHLLCFAEDDRRQKECEHVSPAPFARRPSRARVAAAGRRGAGARPARGHRR